MRLLVTTGLRDGTAGAVRYAQVVRQRTHDLVYFTPLEVLTATERTQLLARAIGVVEGTIDAPVIDETDHLRGLQIAQLPVSGFKIKQDRPVNR